MVTTTWASSGYCFTVQAEEWGASEPFNITTKIWHRCSSEAEVGHGQCNVTLRFHQMFTDSKKQQKKRLVTKKKEKSLFSFALPKKKKKVKRSSSTLRGLSASHLRHTLKFPDPWHWMKNCLEQWVKWAFRFYQRYIHENSRAKKRETTLYSTSCIQQQTVEGSERRTGAHNYSLYRGPNLELNRILDAEGTFTQILCIDPATVLICVTNWKIFSKYNSISFRTSNAHAPPPPPPHHHHHHHHPAPLLPIKVYRTENIVTPSITSMFSSSSSFKCTHLFSPPARSQTSPPTHFGLMINMHTHAKKRCYLHQQLKMSEFLSRSCITICRLGS